MTAEENEQLFLFGYVIASEFDRETKFEKLNKFIK